MSDTPFKAGETYRTREEVRTEVLRLALARCGQTDSRPWRTIADELWTWVSRSEDRPELPPAPTPPADDLAAARAEIERLRSVLRDIAEERPYRKGYDQTDVDYEPAFTGTEAMNLARAALLPSPPDAKPAPERERLKGWVNVYPQSVALYDTRAAAHYGAGRYRTACIDLSQHFVGEGLEP